ncbi:MAG: hypothetical protein ACK5LX_02825 [Oscillospiraceae bacterium]
MVWPIMGVDLTNNLPEEVVDFLHRHCINTTQYREAFAAVDRLCIAPEVFAEACLIVRELRNRAQDRDMAEE